MPERGRDRPRPCAPRDPCCRLLLPLRVYLWNLTRAVKLVSQSQRVSCFRGRPAGDHSPHRGRHLPSLGPVDFRWSESPRPPVLADSEVSSSALPPGKTLLETELALSHICLSPTDTVQCRVDRLCPSASRTKELTILRGHNSAASSGEGLAQPHGNSERSSSSCTQVSLRSGQSVQRAVGKRKGRKDRVNQ